MKDAAGRNVFLEIGAIPQVHGPRRGLGLGLGRHSAHLMDTVLREKILFGTDRPMMRYDCTLEEMQSLELRDESLEAYLSGNGRTAARADRGLGAG